MDMLSLLSTWGATRAAACEADRAADNQAGPSAEHFRQQARTLHESANRLHREIMGRQPAREGSSHGR